MRTRRKRRKEGKQEEDERRGGPKGKRESRKVSMVLMVREGENTSSKKVRRGRADWRASQRMEWNSSTGSSRLSGRSGPLLATTSQEQLRGVLAPGQWALGVEQPPKRISVGPFSPCVRRCISVDECKRDRKNCNRQIYALAISQFGGNLAQGHLCLIRVSDTLCQVSRPLAVPPRPGITLSKSTTDILRTLLHARVDGAGGHSGRV